MKKVTLDPHTLTIKEALSLINTFIEGRVKRAHTFEGAGFGLCGCDMDLSTIKKRMKEGGDIRLSGPNMNGMNHGLAYFTEGRGYTFVETDMDKVNKLISDRNLEL